MAKYNPDIQGHGAHIHLSLLDKITNKTVSYSSLDQQFIESLASQAAVTITKKTLIDDQKNN